MEKKLSIEELLAKVESKSKPTRKRLEKHTNTLRYIREFNFEAGTMKVPTYVIFWHYRIKWEGPDRHQKANKTVFFRTFNQNFPSYRNGKQRYYLLKEGVIEVTPEIIKEAKLYDQTKWKRKNKKAQKGTPDLQLSGQEGNFSNET